MSEKLLEVQELLRGIDGGLVEYAEAFEKAGYDTEYGLQLVDRESLLADVKGLKPGHATLIVNHFTTGVQDSSYNVRC